MNRPVQPPDGVSSVMFRSSAGTIPEPVAPPLMSTSALVPPSAVLSRSTSTWSGETPTRFIKPLLNLNPPATLRRRNPSVALERNVIAGGERDAGERRHAHVGAAAGGVPRKASARLQSHRLQVHCARVKQHAGYPVSIWPFNKATDGRCVRGESGVWARSPSGRGGRGCIG